MKEIYLDNAATTKPCKKAIENVVLSMQEYYGNPSSLHSKGFESEQLLTLAKKNIASIIKASENEIYFTSGGTESNNLALQGAAMAKKRLGNKIVTSAIEHSSVFETASYLEKLGFEVVFLQPDVNGNISEEQIFNAIDSKTILVSMMIVNNEVGSILPVNAIKNAVKIKNSPALIHMDAVQAFGKIPINCKTLGADLLSISAHKIHGPKGVGAIYKSKNCRILPIIFGGEQQAKLRPGTEATPLISGFSAACQELGDINKNLSYIKNLNSYLRDNLKKFANIIINSPDNALPYILNLSVKGIKSETMLHFLSSRGIFVSSGSACSKGKQSRVLKAMGLPKDVSDSAIRVSFSKNNTTQEIDFLLENLNSALETLARSK